MLKLYAPLHTFTIFAPPLFGFKSQSSGLRSYKFTLITKVASLDICDEIEMDTVVDESGDVVVDTLIINQY